MAQPDKNKGGKPPQQGPGISSLLVPYKGMIVGLVLFSLLSNSINLFIPKLVQNAIDSYRSNNYDVHHVITYFLLVVVLVFVFSYLQSIVQTYASERVARDMRTRLSIKISNQSSAYIEKADPSKLLTNLTSDVDSIKLFVSQAIVSIASSIFIIVGASIFLFTINWRLALTVIAIIPIIGFAFFTVLRKVRAIFMKSREIIDRLNKVINESILGSALIRVVNSQIPEYNKFLDANTKARTLGLSILRLFAGLIPVIIFVSNLSRLTILEMGGHFVINGSMSLGQFAAFSSYLAMLIFPIIVIGFMSNIIAQATASYQRIGAVLNAPDPKPTGTLTDKLTGAIQLNEVSLLYGQKPALRNVSLSVKPGSRIAIIGPTAAGKTQLLYLLTNLIKPTQGEVLFDGHQIDDFNQEAFHSQVGFVFQDSIIFNMSIRENIAFSDTVTDESLKKAIETAELSDFVDALPEHLNTIVSERGSSLSGGQKQRIMLARALAVNPQILLLDDFTARVDNNTEKKILANVQRNYPGLTLISVTQKISAIEHYDQIIVLTQGEIVAQGSHAELMDTSAEYVQIYNSQQSTSNYEVRS